MGSYHAVSQCQFAGFLHDEKRWHRRHAIAGAVVRIPIGKDRVADRVQLKHVRRCDSCGAFGFPHVCRVSPAGDSCGGKAAMPDRLCVTTHTTGLLANAEGIRIAR